MRNNCQSYRINFKDEKIIITKKFAKEASVLNSDAYNIIKKLRNDFPNYPIIQKEIKKKRSKQSYANLTIQAMREHIALLEGKDSEMMRQFDYLYSFYESHRGRYAKMKAWYLEQYKDEYRIEDNEEKKQNDSTND